LVAVGEGKRLRSPKVRGFLTAHGAFASASAAAKPPPALATNPLANGSSQQTNGTGLLDAVKSKIPANMPHQKLPLSTSASPLQTGKMSSICGA
jgi:hypothetical protein